MTNDRFRPLVHFTPPRNWANDPNGLIWDNGHYHLFYQHNPFEAKWGHLSWGHAISKDLLSWEHLPVALAAEKNLMIFSGSTVYDKYNTAGFGEGTLIAIYTGHQSDSGLETQNIAWSADQGKTWTKYSNNPVLDIGLRHFRDPSVHWHAPTRKWIMTVTLSEAKQVQFYGSSDLKSWSHLSTFGPRGATDVLNWECPELLHLPVMHGNGDHRWVLKVDVGSNAQARGSGGQYFVGEFDGEVFKTSQTETLWLDGGADFYAAQAFRQHPGALPIWLGWMNNWAYAHVIPTELWRGQMTFPRECALVSTPAGLRLGQKVLHWTSKLRAKPALEVNASAILANRPVVLPVTDEAIEIRLALKIGNAHRAGIQLGAGDAPHTLIGFDAERESVFIERNQKGHVPFHNSFAGCHTARIYRKSDDWIHLTIIVDRCSVELFADPGGVVITDLIFPESRGLAVFAEGGSAVAGELVVYPLRQNQYKHTNAS